MRKSYNTSEIVLVTLLFSAFLIVGCDPRTPSGSRNIQRGAQQTKKYLKNPQQFADDIERLANSLRGQNKFSTYKNISIGNNILNNQLRTNNYLSPVKFEHLQKIEESAYESAYGVYTSNKNANLAAVALQVMRSQAKSRGIFINENYLRTQANLIGKIIPAQDNTLISSFIATSNLASSNSNKFYSRDELKKYAKSFIINDFRKQGLINLNNAFIDAFADDVVTRVTWFKPTYILAIDYLNQVNTNSLNELNETVNRVAQDIQSKAKHKKQYLTQKQSKWMASMAVYLVLHERYEASKQQTKSNR